MGACRFVGLGSFGPNVEEGRVPSVVGVAVHGRACARQGLGSQAGPPQPGGQRGRPCASVLRHEYLVSRRDPGRNSRTAWARRGAGVAVVACLAVAADAPAQASAPSPHLGPPDQWPSCPRKAGLFPLQLAQGVDRGLHDRDLYRLNGMYLAVLAARMATSQGDHPGHQDSLFPDQPRPRPGIPCPWDDFAGPLPGDTIQHLPRRRPGTAPDWWWPQDFIHDLVRWARALLGCRGRWRSPKLSWPWIMRCLWGGRSQPPQTTGWGVRACR